MKLSSILPLSVAFSTALSHTFTLPELADGAYVISLDVNGKQVVTDVVVNATDAAPSTIPKRETTIINSRINKRYNWPSGTYPWCPGGDWFLQADFYDHGWNAFYSGCLANGNNKFPAGTLYVQYQGNSVSYMCAYTANPCNVEEWVDAVNWVSANCAGRGGGWMEPGTLPIAF